MKSLIKKARLLSRMTQVEVAKAVRVSQPTYQRWESGASSVPKSKIAKLAKVLSITERQVEGLPEPFDLLGVNPDSSDARKYFGEVAVHFIGGSPPLLLPITEAERFRFGKALHGEDAFIQMESLDNRMVFVRRRAIADVFFSSEDYDTYGPESGYGSQHLGVHPDANFWKIVEYLDCTECLVGEFSQQEIEEVAQKIRLEDAELDELVISGNIDSEKREKVEKASVEIGNLYISRARDITWQIPGCCCRSVSMDDSKGLYDIFYSLVFRGEQEMLYFAPDGYHREVFLNLSAIDYIVVPAHKFWESALHSGAQDMDDVE